MTKMIFDLNKASEAVSLYKEDFEPGIHNCIMTGAVYGELENEKKTPYIAIGFTNEEGTRMHTERLFLTEAALDKTLGRIKHLIKNAISEAAAEKSYSVEELNSLLANKKVRVLFQGEEYMYEGDIRMRTVLKFFGFAESVAVPMEKSMLRFNPNRDIKKYKGEDGAAEKPASVEVGINDIPNMGENPLFSGGEDLNKPPF